jgi:hypothetical protein
LFSVNFDIFDESQEWISFSVKSQITSLKREKDFSSFDPAQSLVSPSRPTDQFFALDEANENTSIP